MSWFIFDFEYLSFLSCPACRPNFFIGTLFQVDSFLIEEGGSIASSEPEPEFLLSRAPPHSPEPEYQQQPGAGVDQETQARLEALLEAAGISRLSGESKQLADPDILRRLTSSVR